MTRALYLLLRHWADYLVPWATRPCPTGFRTHEWVRGGASLMLTHYPEHRARVWAALAEQDPATEAVGT